MIGSQKYPPDTVRVHFNTVRGFRVADCSALGRVTHDGKVKLFELYADGMETEDSAVEAEARYHIKQKLGVSS